MGLALVTLIGDNMKRVVFILGLFAFTCILVNNNLLARQKQIQIIGQLGAESGQSFVLTQKMMEANATTYTSQDPNFPDDGKKEFKGITIEKIIELTKADENIDGVTFIANNVYVTYEPIEQIRKDNVMIAFSSNGKRIKKNRGGPYMVMHEQVGDQGLYNWYIDTVILGTSLTPELTVVEGGNSRVMDAKAIATLPGELLNYVPPVPRGYRKPLASPDRDTQTEGALLRDFLTSDNFNEVVLTPYVGKSVTLKKEDLSKPIMVLRSFDNQKIISAYGGPYSVVFPVAEHPDLAGRLPQFLFFLQKIETR